MCKVVVLLNKSIAFLMFLLWPDLKIPNVFKTCLTDKPFLEKNGVEWQAYLISFVERGKKGALP